MGAGGGERRQPGKREGVKLATAILVQYLFPPPLLVGAVATNVVNEYACLQTGLRIGGRLSPRRPSLFCATFPNRERRIKTLFFFLYFFCWGEGAAYYHPPPLNLESRGGVFQNGPVATHPLPEDGVRQWAAAWQLVCRVVALRSVRQRQAGGDARQLLGWTVGRAAGEAVGLAG